MALNPVVEQQLARLAPDQRAAATAPPGPILCVAPAGSGKTTTLVARICWLVATGADPEQITAVTFNKRAADELNERLMTALAPISSAGRPPRVRTFHALGREILPRRVSTSATWLIVPKSSCGSTGDRRRRPPSAG